MDCHSIPSNSSNPSTAAVVDPSGPFTFHIEKSKNYKKIDCINK